MKLFGKIDARELAKVLTSGIIVRFSRILSRCEGANMDELFVYTNHGSPRWTINVKAFVNAFESCGTSNHIVHVLCRCAVTQVFTSIVQLIMVSMVAIKPRWSVRYHAVHKDSATTGNMMNCHPTIRGLYEKCLPRPQRNPFIIFRINDSSLTASERNISVRFVQRLRHFMPQFCWHGSLS
jgi:hypothetical protein